jgi:hypothetical protein
MPRGFAGLRLWLDMTLDEFAKHIGAANEAVIYINGSMGNGNRPPCFGNASRPRHRGCAAEP